MRKIPRIVSVTALRDRAASVLTALRDSDDPMIITQRGRAAAILLSVKAYEQYARESRNSSECSSGQRRRSTERLASTMVSFWTKPKAC